MISIAVEPLAASEGIPSGWKQLSLTRHFRCVRETCCMLSVLRQRKADVPEAETFLAGQHLIGKRVWTLEAVQEGFEVDQCHSHLLKKGTKKD